MKMEKKGFVRILEAGLAAMILLGFVYFVTLPSYVERTSLEKEVYKPINVLLDEIERNDTLSERVLTEDKVDDKEIYYFVKRELKKRQLDGNITVCDLNKACKAPPDLPEKDIFVSERVIAGLDLNKNFISKKIAIHAWTMF